MISVARIDNELIGGAVMRHAGSARSHARPRLMLLVLTLSLWLAPRTGASAVKTAPISVERYLSIRTATVAGLSPDAKTVAFLMNTTGSNQIWTVQADGGWPDHVRPTPEAAQP